MSSAAPTPDEGLGRFEDYTVGRAVPESFWTDDIPIGEVPPMDQYDVIHRAIERVGREVWADRDAVVKAARAWRATEARTDFGSTEWQIATERLRDAVDRLPVVFDLPAALVENRRAEVERLDLTRLARGILSGGAL